LKSRKKFRDVLRGGKYMQCIGGVNVKDRGHLKDQGVNVSKILKRILRKSNAKGWNGVICLVTGTVGLLFLTWLCM
jgi:hypothetical protein